MDDNDVYYKIYQTYQHGPKIICMQWFDEFDYDQKKFLTGEKFDTEEAAQCWLDKQCVLMHRILSRS